MKTYNSTALLVALFIFVLACQANPSEAESTQQPDDHEYYLSHRTCFAFMIGLDWVQDAMNKVIEQSVERFSLKYHYGSKSDRTPIEEKLKSLRWTVSLLPRPDGGPAILAHTNESISVARDLAVTARLTDVSLSFRAKLTLHLIYGEDEKSLVPQLSSKLTGFRCDAAPMFAEKKQKQETKELACKRMKKELSNYGLSKMIFARLVEYFESEGTYRQYFRLDLASQVLVGLVEQVNDFPVEDAERDKLVYIDAKRQRLNVLLNCNQKSVQRVEAHESGKDREEFKVSLMQNVLEFLFEDQWHLKVQDFEHLAEQIPWQMVQQFNFDPALEETLSLVKSKAELSMLVGEEKLPDITTRKRYAVHHEGDLMDRTVLQQNYWLKLSCPQGSFADTYFRLEGALDFIHVFREGVGSIFGHSQELKSQRMGFEMRVHDCITKTKQLPQSPFAAHMCKPETLQFVNEHMDQIIMNRLIHEFTRRQDATWNNKWYVLPVIDYSFHLLCAGIQLKQPEIQVFEEMAILTTEKAEWPLDIDLYCRDRFMSQRFVLPDYLSNDTNLQDSIQRELTRFQDVTAFHYLMFIDDSYWTTLKQKQVSPLLHILSTRSAYKNLCHADYQDYPWVDRCAMVHASLFPHDLYDNFDHPVKPWAAAWSLRRWLNDQGLNQFSAELIYGKLNEFYGVETQILITLALKITGFAIAGLGAYLYHHGMVLPKGQLIAACFIGNILLHIPSFYIVITRTGMDTTAYLNQAGAWLAGQTDYKSLNTRQGPCYYPAGHLWFYQYWYRVYVSTSDGEYYLKLFHVVLHSVANSVMALLAYNYFGPKNRLTPQLICLMMLSNHCVRREESLLFNDQIMYSISIVAVYCLSVLGLPLLAAFLFSVSMSIKAGTMLYMPAVLGIIQYRFGMPYLLSSVALIVMWQAYVAYPFLKAGGGETELIDYIHMSKLFGGNGKGEPGWGANQEWSIYWQFIPHAWYSSHHFLSFTKYTMLALNTYHFFVRQNALPRCLQNIRIRLPTKPPGREAEDVRFSIECLFIGNMCGIIMVPGAHSQFQFWYTYSIPLLVTWLPMPWFLGPLCYLFFFPAAQAGSSTHHLFIIGLTLWLVFVGPRKEVNRLKDVAAEGPQDLKEKQE